MDPEVALAKAATIHPPEYIQAVKDFLAKKITYQEMQKICHPEKKPSGCCEGAK
jgi:hypothetical protein